MAAEIALQPLLPIVEVQMFIVYHPGGDALGVGVSHRQIAVIGGNRKAFDDQALDHQGTHQFPLLQGTGKAVVQGLEKFASQGNVGLHLEIAATAHKLPGMARFHGCQGE